MLYAVVLNDIQLPEFPVNDSTPGMLFSLSHFRLLNQDLKYLLIQRRPHRLTFVIVH